MGYIFLFAARRPRRRWRWWWANCSLAKYCRLTCSLSLCMTCSDTNVDSICSGFDRKTPIPAEYDQNISEYVCKNISERIHITWQQLAEPGLGRLFGEFGRPSGQAVQHLWNFHAVFPRHLETGSCQDRWQVLCGGSFLLANRQIIADLKSWSLCTIFVSLCMHAYASYCNSSTCWQRHASSELWACCEHAFHTARLMQSAHTWGCQWSKGRLRMGPHPQNASAWQFATPCVPEVRLNQASYREPAWTRQSRTWRPDGPTLTCNFHNSEPQAETIWGMLLRVAG